MKRIKLRQHNYLALYQTRTDSGQPIAFEIARPPIINQNTGTVKPLIKTIPANRPELAHHLFNTLAILMEIYGPRLNPKIKRLILTGCGTYDERSHKRSDDMSDLTRNKRKK